MRRRTFATVGFDRFRKKTRRDLFLEEMDRIVPWDELVNLIEPVYPSGERGRPPIGLERMLRIYLLQCWFDLSDPRAEEQLHDSRAMRTFAGIDLGRERAPDETTICKFRGLLERRGFGEAILKVVGERLGKSGVLVRRGTVVDATIVDAPTSTKNRDRKRDPEMGRTHKGGRWFFGLKAHIGMDSRSKYVHAAEVTPANVHDSRVVGKLLHGAETKVWGDKAYVGRKARIRAAAPRAQDHTLSEAARNRPLTEKERRGNRTKSRVRARAEHPFLVLKRVFGFRKTRFRGLAKNARHIKAPFALVNLYSARRTLLRAPPA